MNPFVFIVGCPRSGTTLLQRLVDANPLVAITPSMHWISRYFKEQEIRRPEDPVTPVSVSGLLDNPRFARFGIPREDLEGLVDSYAPLTYSGLLAAFFELYAAAEGKPLVGNKTAPYVRSIPKLHALWPEAKFVHVIRDGRDVCLSVMDWDRAEETAGRYATWEEDPVSTAALWWKRKVLLGREGGSPLGPGFYHEVRYEALVSEPALECEALCEFLGVPYDEAMLRFDERREGLDPDLERAHPLMPITAGLRDWRTGMPEADVERFEAAAGDLLEELGYPLSSEPRVPEGASRIGDSFLEDARGRGRKMPEGWRR